MTTSRPEREFLPDLFLLGAAKCGTTTLYAYLDEMPDICMANPKEPRFFDSEFEKGLGFYQSQYFAHWKGERVIGDAQHRNLYLPFVPRRIHGVNPNAKLMAILRDPIERAHSHWYHNASRGRESLDFEQSIKADMERLEREPPSDSEEAAQRWVKWLADDPAREAAGQPRYRTYFDSGFYFEQIQRYLALFPRENLKVILFEDMVAKPEETVNDVVRFMGLDLATNHWQKPVWRNPATPDGRLPADMRVRQSWLVRKTLRLLGMKHKIKEEPPPAHKVYSSRPPIEPKVAEWLRGHYREHNRRLGEFLQRDLSTWGSGTGSKDEG